MTVKQRGLIVASTTNNNRKHLIRNVLVQVQPPSTVQTTTIIHLKSITYTYDLGLHTGINAQKKRKEDIKLFGIVYTQHTAMLPNANSNIIYYGNKISSRVKRHSINI